MTKEFEEQLIKKCKITSAELVKISNTFIDMAIALSLSRKTRQSFIRDSVYYNSKLVEEILSNPRLSLKTAISFISELKKIIERRGIKQNRNGLGVNKKQDDQYRFKLAE